MWNFIDSGFENNVYRKISRVRVNPHYSDDNCSLPVRSESGEEFFNKNVVYSHYNLQSNSGRISIKCEHNNILPGRDRTENELLLGE